MADTDPARIGDVRALVQEVGDAVAARAAVAALTAHTGDTANPHGVTAAQVGAPSFYVVTGADTTDYPAAFAEYTSNGSGESYVLIPKP